MNLKKLTAFGMAAVLSLSLFGCSSKAESESSLGKYYDENGYIKEVDTSAVTLADYANLVVPADQHTPDEESILSWMNYYLSSYNVYEGEVYDGATLNIDYVGYIEGVAFDGGNTNGAGTEVTIGVTNYIDGFLPQLVGHTVGETFPIEVTFPADYSNTELAGKDATFMVTINYIVEPVAAKDLTDAMVAEAFGEVGYTTVEEFRAAAVEELSNTMVLNYLYTEVFEKSTMETVPQAAIDAQKDYVVLSTTMQAESYGYTVEDFLTMYGIASMDEYLEYNTDTIEAAAKETIITQAIAEKEGITVEKADIEEYFGGNDYSEVEKAYGEGFIKFLVLQNKTFDWLVNSITKG